MVPNVELISFEDKTLLIVEVYPSGLRPHWLRKEGPEERVYVRLGSTNRKASLELIAELKRSAQSKSFDERLIIRNLVTTDPFLSVHCTPVLYEYEPASADKVLEGCPRKFTDSFWSSV